MLKIKNSYFINFVKKLPGFRKVNEIDNKVNEIDNKVNEIDNKVNEIDNKVNELNILMEHFFRPKINELITRGLTIENDINVAVEHFLKPKVNELIGRSLTIENDISVAMEHFLKPKVNELIGRSLTAEHVINSTLWNTDYLGDLIEKIYKDYFIINNPIINSPYFNVNKDLVLLTNFPVATTSNDQISPESTVEGRVRHTAFVMDCLKVIGNDLKCLEIGVGSAGAIFEFAMHNVMAVGIEGSDFCKSYNIGYWPLIKNNLFMCDATKDFKFIYKHSSKQVQFNLVMMWEVLEHITERDLPFLFKNITDHLIDGDNSYFIGSISMLEYLDASGNKYHVTVKPKDWWENKFIENGLRIITDHPFNSHLFCRGVGNRYQDRHDYFSDQSLGFQFVAKKIE